MMKLFVRLLKPYINPVSMKIINRLVADNERLNREWKMKYYEMEREMYYWKDKYMDSQYESDSPRKST